MTVLPVLAVGILMKFVAVLFVLVSVVLILVILIQKGRGGGLSGAFGGGMAGGLLGSKTGDFLTWVTIVLVAVFLTLAVIMGRFYKPSAPEAGIEPTVESSQPAPEAEASAPTMETTPAQPQEAAPTQEAAPSADANSAGG